MLLNSLKTKLICVYIFLVILVVIIKVTTFHYYQLPPLYALEAISDEKDINRIKMAFASKVKELGVINYDYAVWDDTYSYIDVQDPEYTDSNYVNDTYMSLDIDGIHIYDKQAKPVWYKAWNKKDWSPLTFQPFINLRISLRKIFSPLLNS